MDTSDNEYEYQTLSFNLPAKYLAKNPEVVTEDSTNMSIDSKGWVGDLWKVTLKANYENRDTNYCTKLRYDFREKEY